MRNLLILVALIAAFCAAVAIYLVTTTPDVAPAVELPLSPSARALVRLVPADAELFAYVPAAAAVESALRRNPITADAVETWLDEQQLPPAWMLGGADLVMWRSPAGAAYAFRLDRVRAVLLRLYLLLSPSAERIDDTTFLIGTSPAGPRLDDRLLSDLDALAAGIPPGQALLVQLRESQTFPPIGRPAVSTVSVSAHDIDIVSRARSSDPAAASPRTVTLPDGALLSAWVGEPPRLIGDLDRLLPGDISAAMRDGGSIVLYDVDSGRLLPRPRGLFVVPDTPAAREAANRLSGFAELVGEVESRDQQVLIALDRTSLGTYRGERFSEVPFPASQWALRLDAARLVPVLERLGDNRGLRFAAPRLSRSVRNLRSWIGHMRRADRIEAALVANAGGDELRVRIRAK